MNPVLLIREIIALMLIALTGYVLRRRNIVHQGESRILSVFTVYVVLPCVILNSFQIDFTDELKQQLLISLGAAAAIHAVIFLIGGLMKKVFSLTPVEQASVLYPNAGNILIPLIMALLGEKYVVFTSTFAAVQMILLWTHCWALINGERLKDINIKKILCNPNMIAIIVSVIMLAAKIRLPEVLHSAVKTGSGAIGPVNMFLIGILMADTDMKKVFSGSRIYIVAALRMLAMPLAVLLLIKTVGFAAVNESARMVLLIAFMAVCGPSATTIVQQAELCGKDSGYASAINVFTTLSCVLTMPLMIILFNL